MGEALAEGPIGTSVDNARAPVIGTTVTTNLFRPRLFVTI
jgi:hypothetical protein